MDNNKQSTWIPFTLLGLGLLLLAGSAWIFFRNSSPQTDLTAIPAEVDYPAPDLTLSDLNGIPHTLADFRGQVVLVNLWATWCPPCKKEMPALQAFHDKYKDEGFTMIAINDGDPEADVRLFVGEYQLTFPVWLDPTYIATEQAFKTLNLPSSFVIDREGIIRFQWVGGINRKTLETYISPIIKETQ